MGNKQGSLANHLETASKTGALAFPDKVSITEFVFKNNLTEKTVEINY